MNMCVTSQIPLLQPYSLRKCIKSHVIPGDQEILRVRKQFIYVQNITLHIFHEKDV